MYMIIYIKKFKTKIELSVDLSVHKFLYSVYWLNTMTIFSMSLTIYIIIYSGCTLFQLYFMNHKLSSLFL